MSLQHFDRLPAGTAIIGLDGGGYLCRFESDGAAISMCEAGEMTRSAFEAKTLECMSASVAFQHELTRRQLGGAVSAIAFDDDEAEDDNQAAVRVAREATEGRREGDTLHMEQPAPRRDGRTVAFDDALHRALDRRKF